MDYGAIKKIKVRTAYIPLGIHALTETISIAEVVAIARATASTIATTIIIITNLRAMIL